MKKIGRTEYTTFNDLWNDKDFLNDEDKARIEFEAALIGKLIEVRDSKGVTQQELAQMTGLKQSAIARLESMKSTPQIDTLFKILKPLGYTLVIVPDPAAKKREAKREAAEIEAAQMFDISLDTIKKYKSIENPKEYVKRMIEDYNETVNYLLDRDDIKTPAPKPPYDFQEILQEPDAGQAMFKWHVWKRQFNIPDDEYLRGEEEIANKLPLPGITSLSMKA
jgi:transcriptional regulator with XRE-family HTH domain